MSNAKEKANELFKKMYEIRSQSASDITKYFAKQSALIAVDEILNSRPLDPNYVDWDDCGLIWYEAQKQEALEFWNDVKSELQSL